MGEIIGQTLDADTGYPTVHVAILVGSNREVFAWGVPNLGAPNGIHICRRPADQLEGPTAAPCRAPAQSRWSERRHRRWRSGGGDGLVVTCPAKNLLLAESKSDELILRRRPCVLRKT